MAHSDLSQETLRELASKWSSLPPQMPLKIHTDTSDFFRLEYGDILVLDGHPFLIRHNAKEGRFGIDDDEKFWVKRAIDLRSGMLTIIKCAFFEKFISHIGDIEFECFRSPKKEARILELVDSLPNFMHGYATHDDHGNIVRVLQFIYGPSLPAHVANIAAGNNHEIYFHRYFPEILNNYIDCIEAVRFLHDHGQKHGDIRRDHILIDRESGKYRWIDFDYNFRQRESLYGYDLFGLGNVLVYLAGMGDVLYRDLRSSNHPALDKLTEEDVNIVFNNRIANLKKIYPYIPERFNRILMHFSRGANVFYDHTTQLLEDLREVQPTLEASS